MPAHPFVLASKLGVLQKLLEGDPQTITGVAIAIPDGRPSSCWLAWAQHPTS